jgi:protein TonB
MIVATLGHFALFSLFPEMVAEDVSINSDQFEAIELPPEIEIPPPPAQIARPATPIIAAADINEDITIAPTTFEDNPVEALPPPPEEITTTKRSAPGTFTPFTVRPDVKNRREVQKALEREYPPLLRDAGIGGKVVVWFYINEEGTVEEFLVKESSGHSSLDAAALEVASIIEFTPALNRDKRVPVWIEWGITFNTK